MKISDYKGYEIHLPTSGGKAGKGCAVTSNVQLRQGNCIVKQFQFVVANPESQKLAAQKARAWADKQKDPFRTALYNGGTFEFDEAAVGLGSGFVLALRANGECHAGGITRTQATALRDWLNRVLPPTLLR